MTTFYTDYNTFCAHDSIENVQLVDMGSYQCAVLSDDHQTLSEEGSIQLEGESTCIHCPLVFSLVAQANFIYKTLSVQIKMQPDVLPKIIQK